MSDGCKIYGPLLHCLLDGEVTEEERAAAEAHLAACPACAARYQELESVHLALQALEVPVPEGLRERTMARIRQERSARRQRTLVRWTRGLVAAAACCAFIFLGAGLLRLDGADKADNAPDNSGGVGSDGFSLMMDPPADMPADGSDSAAEGEVPLRRGADGDNGDNGTDLEGSGKEEEAVNGSLPGSSAGMDGIVDPTVAPNLAMPCDGEELDSEALDIATVETGEAAVGDWLALYRPGEEGPFYLPAEEAAALGAYLEEAGAALDLPAEELLLVYVPAP